MAALENQDSNLLETLNIGIVPYYVSFDTVSYYKEILELTPETFYDEVKARKVYPKTSLPPIQDMMMGLIFSIVPASAEALPTLPPFCRKSRESTVKLILEVCFWRSSVSTSRSREYPSSRMRQAS